MKYPTPYPWKNEKEKKKISTWQCEATSLILNTTQQKGYKFNFLIDLPKKGFYFTGDSLLIFIPFDEISYDTLNPLYIKAVSSLCGFPDEEIEAYINEQAEKKEKTVNYKLFLN